MFEFLEVTANSTMKMNDMKPCQICRIVKSSASENGGHIVMRTASTTKFEVMDLSEPGADSCWCNKPDIEVVPLIAGTEIKIIVKE